MKRVGAILLSIMMVSTVLMSAGMVFAGQPSAPTVDTTYVMTGEWTVAGAEVYTDDVIYLTGNLTIPMGTSLTLTNTTLFMNCTAANRTQIEVLGTLNLFDGGDGLNPMDGSDADASSIVANVSNYNLWVRPGAVLNVQNSEIHGAGNNTNLPPDQWSGIYMQSGLVSITNSLIADNSHCLIFDSCLPALLQNNNISDNIGFGLGIGNMTTPNFNINYVLSDNNIINNGGHGVIFVAPQIDVEVFNMNISENAYGVNLYADTSIVGNVHDCMFWRNDGSTHTDASTIFMLADEDGTVNAVVERNTLIENDGGSIWLGYNEGGDTRSNHTTALVANNTFIGNDGGNKFQANNSVNAKIVDNQIIGSDYFTKADTFRFGYGEDSSPSGCDIFTEYLTVEFSRNSIDLGMYSDDWGIGGLFRTAAKQNMDVTIVGNDVIGGYEIGGVFSAGYPSVNSGLDWTDPDYPVVKNTTVLIEGNNVVMLYEPSSGSGPNVGGVYGPTIASENLDATIINNRFYGTCSNIGMICSLGWWGSGYIDPVKNIITRIEGNEFILHNEEGCGVGGQNIDVCALENIDALIKNNHLEYIDPPDSGSRMGGFIQLGFEESPDHHCNNLTADIINNTIIGTIYGAGTTGGIIWAVARDNTITNITGNDITLNHLQGTHTCWSSFGGVIKLGHYYAGTSDRVVATINDNTIQGNFGPDISSGGAIRASGRLYTDINMNNNVITGTLSPGDEDNVNDFGVRIGYQCEDYGVISENTTVTMNNNIIGPGGKNSALRAGALNHLDFAFDGGEVASALYCDYKNDPSAYGSGICLEGGTIDATISNAEIHDNRGAGIFVESINDAMIDITDCNIHDNYWHGIYLNSQIVSADATGFIEDVLITDNGDDWNGDIGEYGSGLLAKNAVVGLTNCTFDNQYAEQELNVTWSSNVTTLNTTFDKNKVNVEASPAHIYGGPSPEPIPGWRGCWLDQNRWDDINDGTFNITIDGFSADVGPINFAGAGDNDQVAQMIQTAIRSVPGAPIGFLGATVEFLYDNIFQSHMLIISGNKTLGSTITTLKTHSGGIGTDISGNNVSVPAFLFCGENRPHYDEGWNTIDNGTFNITIDGVSADVGPINFTGMVNNWNGAGGVCDLIEAAIQSVGVGGFTNAYVVHSYHSEPFNYRSFYIFSGTYGPNSSVSKLRPHSLGIGTDISGATVKEDDKTMWMDGTEGGTPVPATWWTDCGVNAQAFKPVDSSLQVNWFMDIHTIQQSSGVGLPGTSFTVRDVGNNVVATDTTGLDGHNRWVVASEYFQTSSTKTYSTSHSVSATKGTATGSAGPVTMDTSKEVIVILDYVSLPPVADAGPDQTVDEDAEMTFDGSASTDDFYIVNWTWTSTDTNVTLYGDVVNHTFPEPGVYVFTLTVTDYEGLTDTDDVTITVVDITLPTANAGSDRTVNEDTQVTFNGTGTDNVGIDSWTWTFNDGADRTLYGAQPLHTFAQPGVYTITLTVADAAGNEATDTVVYTVLDITAPIADAGANVTIPEGGTVVLNCSGCSDNVGIVSTVWSFNDGSNDITISGLLTSYRFLTIGEYQVTLTVMDAANNAATDTMLVTVVDITAPEILIVAPGEALEDVPTNWALIIVFNEPMDTASVEAAFSIDGATVESFVWDAENRYVTITFVGDLDYDTDYSFEIGTNATDVAGNALSDAYTGNFLTMKPPEAESGGFMDYWWIIIVIALVIIIVIREMGGKKEPEEYEDAQPPPEPVTPEQPPEPDTAPEGDVSTDDLLSE